MDYNIMRTEQRKPRKCAVALKGDYQVFKIENYPKWSKTGDTKDVIIFEDCNKDQLEDKYLYWEYTINYKNYVVREVKDRKTESCKNGKCE